MTDRPDIRRYWVAETATKDHMLEELGRSGQASPRQRFLLGASKTARAMQAEPDQPQEGDGDYR